MNKSDINIKFDGEQALAQEALKIIPLIEKHFKPFNGQRAHTKSQGTAAAFRKVVRAFQDEAATLTGARIGVDNRFQSVSIDIDINQPDPNSDHGCNYFKTYMYCGEIKSGEDTFSYEFDQAACEVPYNKILSITLGDIYAARKAAQEAHAALEVVKKSIPYIFSDTAFKYL